MTKCCPLMFNKYGVSSCKGVECGFADEAGGCLIQQALQCYVMKERSQIAFDNTEKQSIIADGWWERVNNGY